MASIARDPGGKRRVLFVAPDEKRKTIRLGKVSQRSAEQVKFRVERLLESKLTGHAVDADTARWVAELAEPLADKFARVGLIQRHDRTAMKLRPFLTDYLARRIDVKPATKEVWQQVVRNLNNHFGGDRELPTITAGHAEDFKMHLIGEGLAPTTVHKRLQFARMFFRAAQKRELIGANPFAEVTTKPTTPTDRQHFVTPAETERLLAVCNPTWRVIVALARYGGLRCPSEVLSLRWQDVDWETERIVVPSPKTAHHPGKGNRTIPLFAELNPILSETFELAPEGAEYVVGGGYRKSANTPSGWRNCNLRTQFERLIKRAGLQPWPRLFHALRASRETELAHDYPLHVVTNWLGNTPRIALRHYLQVTDADFAQAARRGAECGAQVAQNAAQQAHAARRTHSQETTKAPAATRAYATGCDTGRESATASSGEDRIRTCGPVARSRI